MTVAKEMNNGVALLLERMKTHPEEFIAPPNTGASKWGHLIESYMDSLEPEDQVALKDGYKKIHQQRFTEKVLEELVDPKFDGVTLTSKAHPRNTHSASVTLAQSTLNALGVKHTTISVDPSIKQAITTLEEIKKEYETKKKPKTIFGKLFNYQ